MADLLYVFGCEKTANEIQTSYGEDIVYDYETYLAREKEEFMTQEVFNKYHSEQAFSRYYRDLELKDLSLVDSMIPLGSCTVKLNSSKSLDSMSIDGLAKLGLVENVG